jgi:hypothetical protein
MMGKDKIFDKTHEGSLSYGWQQLRGRLLPAILTQNLPWGLIELSLKP